MATRPGQGSPLALTRGQGAPTARVRARMTRGQRDAGGWALRLFGFRVPTGGHCHGAATPAAQPASEARVGRGKGVTDVWARVEETMVEV